jgi:hypothetical protein
VVTAFQGSHQPHIDGLAIVRGRLWALVVFGNDGPSPKRTKKLNTQQKEKELAISSASGARAAGKDTKANDAMQVVKVFAKNGFDEVWTYLQHFRGHDRAHIRVFTLGDDDEMYPTKQGITIRISDVPKLAQAVEALVAAVEARSS